MTNTCLLRQNTSFVATKVRLSCQKFWHDKRVFVMTNICCNKSSVTTKNSLLQQMFCHSKHTFVATKDVFCRDKHVCHSRTFVATKTLLVAAPVDDNPVGWVWEGNTERLPAVSFFGARLLRVSCLKCSCFFLCGAFWGWSLKWKLLTGAAGSAGGVGRSRWREPFKVASGVVFVSHFSPRVQRCTCWPCC